MYYYNIKKCVMCDVCLNLLTVACLFTLPHVFINKIKRIGMATGLGGRENNPQDPRDGVGVIPIDVPC